MKRGNYFRLAAAAFTMLQASTSFATYNANMIGVPLVVSTYDNGAIVFTTSTQPSSHPSCNAAAFAVDPALDPHVIGRMYARLLAAQTSGQSVNIGDSTGNCVIGFIHVHEIG